MADEKACGAIVFTYENGARKYVVIRGTGIYKEYCGFPGGHVEPGETEVETALREVKEEIGLDVTLIEGFRTVDEHFLAREGRPNDRKTNVYFLAEYQDQELTAQESEVSEIVLLDYGEAMECINYEESRRELTEAEEYLNAREATGKHLASVAKAMAQVPFHGFTEGEKSNLDPIVQPFPKWTVDEADGLWCAAFVYYCCLKAGFEIPIRPDECKICHLAGCIAWEELAMGDPRITYHRGGEGFVPEPGDIVLYDRVFENREHDHIGIIVETRENAILAAEGNVNNRSGIIERPIDEHIRAYIRIPDGYRYRE